MFLWKDGFTAHALLVRWAQGEIYVVSGKMQKVGYDYCFGTQSLIEQTEGLAFAPSKLPGAQTTQFPSQTELNRPQSSLKRKRGSSSIRADTAHQPLMTSYSQSINEIETPLGAASNLTTPYALPPNNIATRDSSAPVNYVYEKQCTPKSTKRPQILHRAQADSQEVGNGASPSVLNPHRIVRVRRASNEELGRDGSTSLSPCAQLHQRRQSTPCENSFRDSSIAAPLEARNVVQATPLIDTLPRKKQKQIYRIIGSFQSGIRSVRQQTDSLQKHLDLLQAALGIDTNDENDDSLM